MKKYFGRITKSMRMLLLIISVSGVGLFATMTAVLGVTIEPWAPSVTLAPSNLSAVKVHDMLSWNGKLWIAQGTGINGKNKTFIRSYDITTDTLVNEFEVPAEYTGQPYWRSLVIFNNTLYAGLGNNLDVGGTGDIYRLNGTQWERVLSTDENDVYSLEVFNGKLYAGLGTDSVKAGKLYESTDGTTWVLKKTFTSEFVRSLRTWNQRLYIGLRLPGRLWSFDGTTFFNHGTPFSMAQMKSLVPYGNKLFIGAVPARVLSWDGSQFVVELDARTTDTEIYKGTVYAGSLFFPTNGKTVGGRVWKFDGTSWTQDYVDEETIAQMQVVTEYASYLWLGGGKLAGYPLTLRRTLQEP